MFVLARKKRSNTPSFRGNKPHKKAVAQIRSSRQCGGFLFMYGGLRCRFMWWGAHRSTQGTAAPCPYDARINWHAFPMKNIYRKRYGPVATRCRLCYVGNTLVSIPQAVWASCNFHGYMGAKPMPMFQYRKRYGPVATAYYSTLFHECIVSIPQAVWASCN